MVRKPPPFFYTRASRFLRRDPSPAYIDPRVGRPAMQARPPLPFQYVTQPPSTNTNTISWENPAVDVHFRGQGSASSPAMYVRRCSEATSFPLAKRSSKISVLRKLEGGHANILKGKPVSISRSWVSRLQGSHPGLQPPCRPPQPTPSTSMRRTRLTRVLWPSRSDHRPATSASNPL